MTCIAGLVREGIVYIGGDQLASSRNGDVEIRATPKVVKKGDYIFGFTGSFRILDLLEFVVAAPTPKDKKVSLRQHLVRTWITDLRHLVKEHGYADIDRGVERFGTFMIGYLGELCVVYNDYQVATPLSGYTAIGSGQVAAISVLEYINKYQKSLGAEKAVIRSIEVASNIDAYVGGPITVLSS